MKQLSDLPGIGPILVEKLAEAGIRTVLGVASCSAKELMGRTGVTEASAQKLILAARADSDALKFDTADKIMKKRDKIIFLKTRSDAFNELLGGGFQSGAITECFGKYGSGKTQIAHQLAVTTQMSVDKGGTGGKVIFIDTENTFRPKRIIDFAKALKLDPDKVLKNILVARALNSDHQVLLAETAEKLCEEGKNIKLIIVDSLTAHFRAEYLGRGTLAPRQQKLNKHMHTLARIADNHNACVYVTNQVMAKPDQFFGDPDEPIGGHVVGHNCVGHDSLVVTPQGIKYIKDIQKGDMIYSGFKFVKVLMTSKSKKFTNEIIGNSIHYATDDHKFPTFEKGSFTDKIVKNFKKGDFLLSPPKIDIEEPTLLSTEISQEELIIFQDRMAEEIKRKLKGNFKKNTKLEEDTGLSIRQIRRILNQRYPTLKKNAESLVKSVLGKRLSPGEFVNKYTYRHLNPIFPQFVDSDYLRLYGAWICDGDQGSKRSIRIKDASKKYMDYLGGIAKKWGLNYSNKKVAGKNCHELKINSKGLLDSFKRIDVKKIVGLEENLIGEFCGALIDGDGSVNQGRITFYQTKLELVHILQIMLLRLGIQSRVNKQKQNNEWSRTEYLYKLTVLSPGRGILARYIRNRHNLDVPLGKKLPSIKHPIVSITPQNEMIPTVDLTVEGAYFLCNGTITHNSQYRIYLKRGKAGSKVAKLIDSPDMPDGEAIFIINTDGILDVNLKKDGPDDESESNSQK